jgi:oligosaccharide repeat unit polymerase
MLPLAILTITLLAIANYWIGHKEPFYPPLVFCGIWAFDMFLLWICGDYFYRLSPETLGIFIAGALVFSCGSWLALLYSPAPPVSASPKDSNRIITGMVLLIVVLLPFYARWLYGLISEGGGAVSYLLATQVGVGEVEHQSLLYSIFGTLAEVSGIVAAIAFFERKQNPGRAVLVIIIAFFMGINTGKTGPVSLALAIMFLDWAQHRRIRWKLMVLAGSIMTIAIVAVEFYVHLGGGSDSTASENVVAVVRQVVAYASGPMVAFDQFIRHPNIVPFDHPFYITFARAVKRLGFDVPIPAASHSEFVQITNGGIQHNVFTMYWSYLVFGYPGIILLTFFNGLGATVIYKRGLAGHPISRILYSSILFWIMFSPFAEYFYFAVYFAFKMCLVCWLVYCLPVHWTALARLFRGTGTPGPSATRVSI